MSLIVKDVIRIMEEFAPLHMCAPWDNCGLLVGDENQKVNKIYIALEASLSVIDAAIENKVDMLITHHPLMLNGIKKINNNSIEGKKIIKLINNNISFYVAHTNLDKTYNGLNDYILKKLGLIKAKEINEEIDLLRIGELSDNTSLEIFASKIKEILKLNYIHYVGKKDSIIKRVGVVTGSGMSEIDIAIAEGVDVLITGDVKYHNAIYAKEMGICLIDATHFGTENIVIDLLTEELSKKLKNAVIIKDITSKNPIEIL